ncbi:MAG: 3-methyl-2-oxobutanoate hydroxymethyltransferase [Anaerohalosphaeraceae bacterium]|nr:3-methyl-2-oxobutanoate hydroxymethyltransferase [Anaerohalosphaeraceae bacterium]
MSKKITIKWSSQAKKTGQKFAVISCYDYTSALLAAKCPIEMLLVGDSAAQFMLGFESTKDVPVDYMLNITAAVSRAAPNLLIIADMPYQASVSAIEQIVKYTQRFINEGGADIVKIEATKNDIETIRTVADAKVPVMAHIGIRPQSENFAAQATTAETAVKLIALAKQMVEAGSAMLLLEGIAEQAAAIITKSVNVPVISCGSGPGCDGQVLILPDILGLTDGPKPKFSKSFANVGDACVEAISSYAQQVKKGLFPDDAHCYHMKPGEAEKLNAILK